jgi:hypothetical protein
MVVEDGMRGTGGGRVARTGMLYASAVAAVARVGLELGVRLRSGGGWAGVGGMAA